MNRRTNPVHVPEIIRWPVDLQRTLGNYVEGHTSPEMVNNVANMMARFINAARRHDRANESDAIDELLTTLELKDADPGNRTLGIAAHVEVSILLARQGRDPEAQAALDGPLQLILGQLRTGAETPTQRSFIEASLLFAAAAYVDMQAARHGVASAVGGWGLLMFWPSLADPFIANSTLEHVQKQLTIAAERGYQAVTKSKAAWNYAKATAQPDLQIFALERLEEALRAAGDEPNAALVAARRARFGKPPRRQWIIEPGTWSL